jgi:hypothetical protein
MTETVTGTIDLDKRIENVLHEKLSHFLEDISFRIGQEYELQARRNGLAKGTVFAEDLNIKDRVFLTGYTVTNNSPTAGSIAWADLHVVYNGVDHAITNGNTALQYVYFTASTTPTTLKSSATKPVLSDGDVLLFVNEGGVARNMLSDTNASLPRLVATNAVDTDAIADSAVTGDQIASGAVGAGKIGTGAINNSNLFSGKVVGSGQIVDKAVGSTALGDNAVGSLQLAAGAINNANKFSGKVLSGTNMVDGTVGGTQLGSGAVSAQKLNIMRHVMY